MVFFSSFIFITSNVSDCNVHHYKKNLLFWCNTGFGTINWTYLEVLYIVLIKLIHLVQA